MEIDNIFYHLKISRRELERIIVLGRGVIYGGINTHKELTDMGREALAIHTWIAELGLAEFKELLISEKEAYEYITEQKKQEK